MKDINKITQKAKASWWEDGITEFVAGIGITLIGVWGMLGYTINNPWVQASLIVLIVLSAFAIRSIIYWAKSKWIWPYTGYAIADRRKGWHIFLSYVLIFLLIGTAFLIPATTTLVGGFMGGIILASIGVYSGLKRFYLLAILSILIGFLMYLQGVSQELGIYTLLITLGLVEFLIGLLLFMKFRKEVARGNKGGNL